MLSCKQNDCTVIKYTQNLVKILVDVSKETLARDNVLEMLPSEKAELRILFDETMHHTTTAINILMFFQRRELIDIGDPYHEGKKFKWNEANVRRFYNVTMPKVYDSLQKATKSSNSLSQTIE